MNQPYGAPPQPPPKKGMSTLAIVLMVLGGIFLLGLGTCVAGAFWLKNKTEGVMSELADGGGGIILVSPPAVKAELAGPKKAYVGAWHGSGGNSLVIDAEGNLKLEKHKGGGNESWNAPIAAFSGSDMEIKVLVKVVIKVEKAPHKVGDHWEMTADGVAFERK